MDKSSLRVLVVEDSPAMRAYVTSSLESARPCEVVKASSGFEALKLLPRERFDLIVTDINMPDINGLELIRFIRQSPAHAETPLVVISTDGAERDRDRGMKLGASAYLVKPFTPEQLIATVERLLQPVPKPGK